MTKRTLLGGALGAVASIALDSWEEGKHPRASNGQFGSGGGQKAGPESGGGTFAGARVMRSLQEGALESVRTGQGKEKFLANLRDKGYEDRHAEAAGRYHDIMAGHYEAGKKAAEAGHSVEQARAYARTKIASGMPHAQRAFIEGHGERYAEMARSSLNKIERG